MAAGALPRVMFDRPGMAGTAVRVAGMIEARADPTERAVAA